MRAVAEQRLNLPRRARRQDEIGVNAVFLQKAELLGRPKRRLKAGKAGVRDNITILSRRIAVPKQHGQNHTPENSLHLIPFFPTITPLSAVTLLDRRNVFPGVLPNVLAGRNDLGENLQVKEVVRLGIAHHMLRVASFLQICHGLHE